MLLDISYSYKNIFIAKPFGSVDARMQNWSLQQQQEHRHDESERKSWILMKLSILGALHGCYVEYEVQCMWSGAAQVDYLVFLLSCLLAYKKAYSFFVLFWGFFRNNIKLYFDFSLVSTDCKCGYPLHLTFILKFKPHSESPSSSFYICPILRKILLPIPGSLNPSLLKEG